MNVLKADNLQKRYRDGDSQIEAVKDASLALAEGDQICIEGRSGSGKTTLLNILGLVFSPSSGTLQLDNVNTQDMNHQTRSRFRNEYFGYVVQDFSLIEDETALYNVMLPMIYARKKYTYMTIERSEQRNC